MLDEREGERKSKKRRKGRDEGVRSKVEVTYIKTFAIAYLIVTICIFLGLTLHWYRRMHYILMMAYRKQAYKRRREGRTFCSWEGRSKNMFQRDKHGHRKQQKGNLSEQFLVSCESVGTREIVLANGTPYNGGMVDRQRKDVPPSQLPRLIVDRC